MPHKLLGNALCLTIVLMLASAAVADTIAWNLPSGGDWDTTTMNWTMDGGGRNDGFYVNGDHVTFGNAAGGVINLTADRAPGSTTVNASSGTYTFSGSNITSGNITKSSTGTLVLGTQFTGTGSINVGAVNSTVRLGGSNLISDTASVTGAGGTLDMDSNDDTFRWAGSFAITNMGNLTVFASGTHDRSSAAAPMSGPGSLTFTTGHGQTILNGSTHTFSGGTIINAGILSFYASSGQLPATGPVTVNSGGRLDLIYAGHFATLNQTKTIGALGGDGQVRSSGDIGNANNVTFRVGNGGGSGTFGGVFSGGGSLVKLGAGTQTMNGDNTYTGPTTVSDGTLLVNGTTGPGQDDYTVQSGATLGGSGTINLTGGNSVTIDDGGTLSPGTSAGTLTINGNLILNSSSLTAFELSQPGVSGGGINDLMVVSGDLTLDGTLDLDALPGFSNGTYRLFDFTGSLSNGGVTLDTTDLPSGNYALDFSMANQVNLVASGIVPEPASLAMFGLAAAGFAGLRRRRVRRRA